MTSATKRKHVVKEMLDDYSMPGGNQKIVKVLGTPGSNLHEVVTTDCEKILCSLPLKFRKNIWIKRGDYVVIESIDEGDKVKAEIVRILYPQHVKFLLREGGWPKEFKLPHNEYPEKSCDKLAAEMDKVVIEQTKLPSYNKGDYILNLDEMNKHSQSEDEYYSSDDDLSDIPANTNHPPIVYEDSTSDSDSDFSEDN